MYSTPPGRAGLKRHFSVCSACTQAHTPPGLTVAPGSSRPQTERFIKAYLLPRPTCVPHAPLWKKEGMNNIFHIKGRGLPFLLHSHVLDTHGLYRAYVLHIIHTSCYQYVLLIHQYKEKVLGVPWYSGVMSWVLHNIIHALLSSTYINSSFMWNSNSIFSFILLFFILLYFIYSNSIVALLAYSCTSKNSMVIFC